MASVVPLHTAPPTCQQARLACGSRTFADVFAATAPDAGVVGFVLASLQNQTRPVLWVQDHLSVAEAGGPYLPAVSLSGGILRVRLNRPTDVLQAMEDGLGCSALGGVIGEIWGEPPALSFTATKRLALRSEHNAIPCWLVRRGGTANLSAARNRWRVASLPSTPNVYDAKAPGDPRWRVELFRSRSAQPGTWIVSHDRASDRLHFSAVSGDGAVAASHGAVGERAPG